MWNYHKWNIEPRMDHVGMLSHYKVSKYMNNGWRIRITDLCLRHREYAQQNQEACITPNK